MKNNIPMTIKYSRTRRKISTVGETFRSGSYSDRPRVRPDTIITGPHHILGLPKHGGMATRVLPQVTPRISAVSNADMTILLAVRWKSSTTGQCWRTKLVLVMRPTLRSCIESY
jgi:hypothetical protein